MMTAMTATRKPAKIHPKTAPAHPGWSETSNSEANTWVWGCHGDHGGQNGFDIYNQKWTRWQAKGYLHVIVIFCDNDQDGCSGFDDIMMVMSEDGGRDIEESD